MTYASNAEFNLQRLIQDEIDDFTPEELQEMEKHLFEMELILMDAVAVKRAGGEHLVHWEAAGFLN